MTESGPQWVIQDHTVAHIGDHVTLTRPAGAQGVIVGIDQYVGVPTVEITSGLKAGTTVSMWPSRISSTTKRALD